LDETDRVILRWVRENEHFRGEREPIEDLRNRVGISMESLIGRILDLQLEDFLEYSTSHPNGVTSWKLTYPSEAILVLLDQLEEQAETIRNFQASTTQYH
jgi:DNA-binding Lrp family transcriptional regulator